MRSDSQDRAIGRKRLLDQSVRTPSTVVPEPGPEASDGVAVPIGGRFLRSGVLSFPRAGMTPQPVAGPAVFEVIGVVALFVSGFWNYPASLTSLRPHRRDALNDSGSARRLLDISDPYWLTDDQLERLRPHCPKSHGRLRVDDRRVLIGIMFVNRNGLSGVTRPRPMDHTRHCTIAGSGGARRASSSG